MHESRVQQLLDQLFDSGSTPEAVCAASPELLPEVRRRWQAMQQVQADLAALFPTPDECSAITEPQIAGAPVLPRIPGYEVESLIGRGGMGVVFRARHLRLNRLVAIKMTLSGAYASQAERHRFQKEAEAIAALQHPNIVQIHDVGEFDGRSYFTMEYVDGGNLAQKLDNGPIQPREAASLLAASARAIHAAHEAGIVHRDLKPANILIAANNAPKISDFGLARRMENQSALTHTGAVIGTPSYMSPEQAAGRTSATGTAADVYAIGAILYETLTGWPPFAGESAEETVRLVISSDPIPPSRISVKVPRDLEIICLKCLQKEPSRRYPNAAALADDLDRFLRGEAILARPERKMERIIRRIRRQPVLAAAVVSSFLLVIVLGGGGLWFLSERAAVARAAESDLDDVERLLRQSSWTEARTAVELVKGRLGDGGPAELRGRLDQAERDLQFADQIDAICLNVSGRIGEGPALAMAADAEFEKAFRDTGFGTTSERPEDVAARIAASNIRSALVAALDDWSGRASADPRKKEWLREVARIADPDKSEWRHAVRSAISQRDEKALLELIDKAPPLEDLPVSFLLSLDNCLSPTSPERMRFLARIQQAHISDFWVNLRLANSLRGINRPAESIRHFQAALAIRPNAGLAHNNLGAALSALGRLEDALVHHQRAALLDPKTAHLQYNLAVVLWRLNRKAELIPYLQKAIELDPKDMGARSSLQVALVQLGRGDEVQREWKRELDSDPADHNAWHGYAELCLFLGNEVEYRRTRQRLLAKFGDSKDPSVAERISRAALLLPGSDADRSRAVGLASRAAGVDRKRVGVLYRNFQFAEGLAEFRQGKFDGALAIMQGDAKGAFGTASMLVAAMSLHAIGDHAQARKEFVTAVLAGDWRVSRSGHQDSWMCHLLRREAEQKILPQINDFLAGRYEPQDNEERLALVGICEATGRMRALAKLYAAAFAAEPELADDKRCDHCMLAATAAACAAHGQGLDAAGLDETERKQWRTMAQECLRAKLTAVVTLVDEFKMERAVAAKYLTDWKREPDFAPFREPLQIAALPREEQQDWKKLWTDVATFIAASERAQ